MILTLFTTTFEVIFYTEFNLVEICCCLKTLRVLDPVIITNGLMRAFSTGSWLHFYKSWEKTNDVVAFIRRAAPLQMVSDMRRTRWQVLHAGEAGDARYPRKLESTTSEWPLASDRSPDNMEEAGPSLIEKPTNGSLHLELALENSDHDTMIAAPSVRDLDQLAEVQFTREELLNSTTHLIEATNEPINEDK
ncbi:DNA-directed RNA polymerases IV and V subunit 2-like protein [Tanacetum coccineum]